MQNTPPPIIKTNHSLKNLNTFGVEAKAHFFTEITHPQQLQQLISKPQTISSISANQSFIKSPKLILGGGSNLLFVDDFDGWVIKNGIKGIRVVKENSRYVYIEAQGGENWHNLVLFCVKNNWGGIENLSLIPGLVGAAPIQNIGAYGVELKDVFYSLKATELKTGKRKVFKRNDCDFGYRNSVFKNELKGKLFIESVVLKLHKNPKPNLKYGAVKETVFQLSKNPTIATVSTAICSIREKKLPNPNKIGNAGSFFKNVVISAEKFAFLQEKHPKIPHYPAPNGIKIPSGWLIEKCGWKGKKIGETGTYHNQALVLVNHGEATGREIYDLSEKIIQSVKNHFDIDLEREVNVVL